MIDRLFGPRITVAVSILGVVGGRMVRWRGTVHLRGRTDVRRVLRAAGSLAGVDLAGEAGLEPGPNLLLNGRRLELPGELSAPVADGAQLAWLTPMAGG
jgi:molybdopterin converting factor small subunit